MQLSVTGKQTEIGEALRRHIEGSRQHIAERFRVMERWPIGRPGWTAWTIRLTDGRPDVHNGS